MNIEDIDLYIWEGSSDIAGRIERCLGGTDIVIVRTDPSTEFPPARSDAVRLSIAVLSVTVIGDPLFRGHEWLRAQAIPVIWVAAQEKGHDPRFFPPAYSHTLPLSFTCAELRTLVLRIAGISQPSTPHKASRAAQPLIASCKIMESLLKDVAMYADCDASVLIHGETGTGKERIAQRLHEQSSYAEGAFVGVNCGAVPEGLFEAHFFGHAKGAFTGAIGAHKGYFEQAHNGTLFLDEIGDLPLHQQVKLLRVLEQNTVTRLGSTTEIPVTFRLVSASHRSLAHLVTQGKFRADLYYRLAVIELDVPNLEARGPLEKQLLFRALLERLLPDEAQHIPEWLLADIATMQFPGNIRELANLAERIGIVARQTGSWERDTLKTILERFNPPLLATADEAERQASEGISTFNENENLERQRIIELLNMNGWRRQDTAAELGISRKVLWEKMRKYQINAQGENTNSPV